MRRMRERDLRGPRWRGCLRAIALPGLIGAALAVADAADIERTDIWFSNGEYRYFFAATLNANAADVRAIVADFDRLARLNDDIITSRLLERYDENRLKRRLLLKHCLLVFCFDLDFVENVEILPNGDIETILIPEESSFRHGTSVWRITALDEQHTRVSLEAHQAPKFWIPPVIGPLVVQSSFVAEVTETVSKLERLANEHVR